MWKNTLSCMPGWALLTLVETSLLKCVVSIGENWKIFFGGTSLVQLHVQSGWLPIRHHTCVVGVG